VEKPNKVGVIIPWSLSAVFIQFSLVKIRENMPAAYSCISVFVSLPNAL
jgi:hypothetical protein